MAKALSVLNISNLSLKNFATFEDQYVSFTTKFNAIIGETGSGKSLILDALQLLLGARADKKLIRKNCEFAVVEGTFTCRDSKIKEYFFNIGYPFNENEILIKRILYKSGKTKSYLNHQSCNLNTLTHFSRRFIDLVGQFENQKLLSDNYQMKLVDNYAQNTDLLFRFEEVYSSLLLAQTELENAQKRNVEISQRSDYLNFQLDEIRKLSPSIQSENDLLEKKKLFQNLEENRDSVTRLNTLFDGGEAQAGVLSLVNQANSLLTEKLLDHDSLNDFRNAAEVLNEINYKVNSSINIDFNEDEFENVINTLDFYQKLKRKFSVDTHGLIEVYNRFLCEKEEITSIEDSISSYQEKISALKEEAFTIAHRIHIARVKYSATLSSKLTTEVRKLRMKGATLKVELSILKVLTKTGLSKIEFLAETNPGEGFFKIKEIASGGELSRILLALRKILSAKDSISIFLFDEIDSGIGGETALAVGKALSEVAQHSQVIAITHLPQIANFAQKLVSVSKESILLQNEERTISLIKEISGVKLQAEVKSMGALN